MWKHKKCKFIEEANIFKLEYFRSCSMKNLAIRLAVPLLITASIDARAALINFTGEISNHNDVIYTYFTLDQAATDVRVWTDSFKNALNFDPITALWKADGTKIAQNDDNATVEPGTQTYYDSGFTLSSLAAGNYIFTVAAFDNFAKTSSLADGFQFDNQQPISLEVWQQPANHLDMGKEWSVWLDGVDRASASVITTTTSVPEPNALSLMAAALLGLFLRRGLHKKISVLA
jgi:hypothetical protein